MVCFWWYKKILQESDSRLIAVNILHFNTYEDKHIYSAFVPMSSVFQVLQSPYFWKCLPSVQLLKIDEWACLGHFLQKARFPGWILWSFFLLMLHWLICQGLPWVSFCFFKTCIIYLFNISTILADFSRESTGWCFMHSVNVSFWSCVVITSFNESYLYSLLNQTLESVLQPHKIILFLCQHPSLAL